SWTLPGRRSIRSSRTSRRGSHPAGPARTADPDPVVSARTETSAGYPRHVIASPSPDIATLAGALSDRARVRILHALADGRALPASLLAAEAGVGASTASEHLGKLLDAGLVTVHAQGRHRYFRLRNAEVASLIETLSRLAPPGEVRSLKESNRLALLREAR